MALSCCTPVVTTSPSLSWLGSPVFLPSLSSSLLVHKNGLKRRSSRTLVASYGISAFGKQYQTPGTLEFTANPAFADFQRKFQTPRATAEEGLVLEDVQEPEFDRGDGGGNGRGDENGGSGGGGGGDGSEGEGDGEKKKKAGMSMAQKLTLAYAILVGVGGIMGFAKSGSSKSLMAGGGSASILYYVFLNLPSNPVLASAIGLGISGLLLFIMGSRYLESGKVFPAGVVSLFSLVMAGGYIHGIVRTAH